MVRQESSSLSKPARDRRPTHSGTADNPTRNEGCSDSPFHFNPEVSVQCYCQQELTASIWVQIPGHKHCPSLSCLQSLGWIKVSERTWDEAGESAARRAYLRGQEQTSPLLTPAPLANAVRTPVGYYGMEWRGSFAKLPKALLYCQRQKVRLLVRAWVYLWHYFLKQAFPSVVCEGEES